MKPIQVALVALSLVAVVTACSAIRTVEECEFSCTDCKEVQFRCPTDTKGVDVGLPDITALPNKP
jgi:hypothetical protein